MSEHTPLMHRLYLLWLPTILMIMGMSYLSKKNYKPENEERYALIRLNQWRTQAGIPALQPIYRLKQSAKLHALYLTQNLSDRHNEHNIHNPHFSGSTPQQRATAANYPSGISENLITSNYANSGKENVDVLMTALYHRLSLLDPNDDEVGIGWASSSQAQALVINQGNSQTRILCEDNHNKTPTRQSRYYAKFTCLGKEKDIYLDQLNITEYTGPVMFPIGRNITPTYNGREIPNPMPQYEQTGNPISIAFYGEIYRKNPVHMISFQLFQNQTEITNTHILTHQNDPNHLLSANEFALFPIDVLKLNTFYRVKFVYRHQNHKYQKIWAFTTRPAKTS